MIDNALETYFANIVGISDEIVSRIREKVRSNMYSETKENILPKGLDERTRMFLKISLYLEDVLLEEWDTLSNEEKIELRFPGAKGLGEIINLPNSGAARIVGRNLTRSFSILYTLELPDGSKLTHEFID
jgi:hypothetical protein